MGSISRMASPDRIQGTQFPPLPLQTSSLYNLTFDEVQTQLGGNIGKPLNAMNLDELLRNVISGSFEDAGNLSAHGPLSNKTVEQVWKEIVRQENFNNHHLTLGETTLEDFLVHAGLINQQDVVVSHHQPLMAMHPMATSAADWFRLRRMASDHRHFQCTDGSGLVGENQLATTAMSTAAATSSDSQMSVEKKMRVSEEMMEKTIERRQKRMIKNRESAARSRARKQAYTNQLEHEVMQLRNTNSWLKKQKGVEIMLSSNTSLAPKYQLRRTSSASF